MNTPTRSGGPVDGCSVLVVDDHDLVRDGIRARLSSEPGITICGECPDAMSAIAMAGRLQPDVVLLDISMPGMTGLAAASPLLEAAPETAILFLSIYDNEEYVHEALRLGARGYILKDVSREEMVAAIKAVASGATYLGSRLTRSAMTGPVHQDRYGLTVRERQVLKGIAGAKANKEIARELSISVRTVESHRASIREKTGGGNAAALSRIASELGL